MISAFDLERKLHIAYELLVIATTAIYLTSFYKLAKSGHIRLDLWTLRAILLNLALLRKINGSEQCSSPSTPGLNYKNIVLTILKS